MCASMASQFKELQDQSPSGEGVGRCLLNAALLKRSALG